ncbi:MAG: glycosyltransferase family 2 protein, partial [Chitinophagaceae bacterium]
MKTTVIIPTYNGAHKILFALRSLESQTRPPDEVVVIIDGSSDHTHALLGNESFSLKDLKIINQENTGRARVRNNGALHATGDLLVFMDDDMVARNNWLQAHVEHHEANPLTILTGSALVPETAADADYQKFKIFLSYKWTARLKQYDRQPLPKDALFLSAANFSIPKLLFTNLNGFDASLNDVEDYDLALRALAQSTLVYYSAAADAWHKETATCAQAIKRT